jgi:hypothetical protein
VNAAIAAGGCPVLTLDKFLLDILLVGLHRVSANLAPDNAFCTTEEDLPRLAGAKSNFYD